MAPPRAKKAAPVTVAKAVPVAKAKGQKYEYTELQKVSLTSSDKHNVYGVVIDATFPHKVSKDHYVCSLKIIDPTLHSKSAKASDNDYATVVIYAEKFNDLPICNKVGDIIRLHRATLRMYKNQRQFNVSVHQYGSWAIFSAEDAAYSPTFYSGKRATFEKHESTLLNTLRKWVGTYFASHDGVTSDLYSPLKNATKADKDFDVCAKILAIHELDEFTNELKIADSTGDNWFVLALKLKYPNLRAGQVIRIRSAIHDETSSKQVLNLQHYSNILTFVASSRLAKTVADKVKDDHKHVAGQAHICTEVDKKWAATSSTSLADLFHHDSALSGNTFRTTVQVVKVEGAAADLVKAWNKSTKKSSSAKGVKGGDLIWQASLLCKDASTWGNNNKYRLHVCSHDGLGAEFFGKAANLHSDAAALKKVEKQIANITQFNSLIDVIVEKRGGLYYIKDTKLRC